MLDQFRSRAAEALALVRSATLVTSGASGLQADGLARQDIGCRLFLLVPATSEHLVNLEGNASVVVTAEGWRLRGMAQPIRVAECPPQLVLSSSEDAAWSQVIEVRPRRVELGERKGWGYAETLDLE